MYFNFFIYLFLINSYFILDDFNHLIYMYMIYLLMEFSLTHPYLTTSFLPYGFLRTSSSLLGELYKKSSIHSRRTGTSFPLCHLEIQRTPSSLNRLNPQNLSVISFQTVRVRPSFRFVYSLNRELGKFYINFFFIFSFFHF